MDKVQSLISHEMCTMLEEPFRSDEITEALSQMHPTKAPSPDGMCALFYHKFWDTVEDDVTEKILDILNNGGNIGSLNQTYIALIPKKKRV